jgi:hypothetical protein
MYSRKKQVEEVPEELTVIWVCTKEGCNGWMRDNFKFETTPVCRLCLSPMVQGTRMLPSLVNCNSGWK